MNNETTRRILRRLLRVYPSAHRARFGTGMEYALMRDWKTSTALGFLGRTWFWIRTVLSMVVHGVIERMRGPALRPARPERRLHFDHVVRDVNHAVRRIVRNPGFAFTAVVTLGLGIGATTAIFSIISAVILRSPNYLDPERIVAVRHRSATDELGMPLAGFLHYRERSRTLQDLAIYDESSAPIAGAGEPLELGIIEATPNLLSLLGVVPKLGRDLSMDDSRPDAPPVALVTHGYWVRHLGSDTAVIGKPVLDGARILVVGVLPEDFTFERPKATLVFGNVFETPDIIVPMEDPDPPIGFGNFRYQGVGRLVPGVTIEEAQHEIELLMVEAAETYPGMFTPTELRDGGFEPSITTFPDAIVGNLRETLWMLFASVGVVLLLATVNVANLFLVRAQDRQDEIAIRRALGAGRAAVAGSFLTESVVLALLGGALGTFVATLGIPILLRLAPTEIPRMHQIGVDMPTLCFAVGITIVSGLTFGAAPLVGIGQRDASVALGERSRGGTASLAATRTRKVVVIAQVALAMVLLVGAGLLLKTFQNLRTVNPGFDGTHTATLRLSLSGSLLRAAGRTERAQDAARSRFMVDLMREIEALPGVERAAFSADLPLDRGEFHDFVAVDDQPLKTQDAGAKALRVFIGPGYLEAIGARLLYGRELETREFLDQPRSVVVNRAFAEERWPDETAVGHRVMQYWNGVDPTKDLWYTVVGVVADIHETSLMTPPEPTVYLPTIFLPEGDFTMWVSNMIAVVRVADDPNEFLPRLRERVQALHPEVPVNSLATLDQVTASSFQQVSFAMIVLSVAALLSLLLGIVGIYGAVSYIVSRRTREFGLRIALGATRWNVLRGVLAGAGFIGLTGVMLGLMAAFVASRVVRSMLFGVTATDPALYVGVGAGLLVLVVVSTLGPAVRASKSDPANAMRTE